MSALRKFVRRRWVDTPLDRLRFTLDTLPAMDYQPLPWLGVRKAGRAMGVASRWDAIRACTERLRVQSAVDVGANAGECPDNREAQTLITPVPGADRADRTFGVCGAGHAHPGQR